MTNGIAGNGAARRTVPMAALSNSSNPEDLTTRGPSDDAPVRADDEIHDGHPLLQAQRERLGKFEHVVDALPDSELVALVKARPRPFGDRRARRVAIGQPQLAGRGPGAGPGDGAGVRARDPAVAAAVAPGAAGRVKSVSPGWRSFEAARSVSLSAAAPGRSVSKLRWPSRRRARRSPRAGGRARQAQPRARAAAPRPEPPLPGWPPPARRRRGRRARPSRSPPAPAPGAACASGPNRRFRRPARGESPGATPTGPTCACAQAGLRRRRRSAAIAASIRRAGRRDRAGGRRTRPGRGRATAVAGRRNRWAPPTAGTRLSRSLSCASQARVGRLDVDGDRSGERIGGGERRLDGRQRDRFGRRLDWPRAARRSGRPNANRRRDHADVHDRGPREPEQPARGTTLAHLKRG